MADNNNRGQQQQVQGVLRYMKSVDERVGDIQKGIDELLKNKRGSSNGVNQMVYYPYRRTNNLSYCCYK